MVYFKISNVSSYSNDFTSNFTSHNKRRLRSSNPVVQISVARHDVMEINSTKQDQFKKFDMLSELNSH